MTAAAALTLTAGILITLVTLLQNHSFRQYLIGVAHRKLSDSMGAELHVKDFEVHLSGLNPTVDMFDVTIYGAPPYAEPPLLHVDRLSVGIRIDSFIQRRWHFSTVEADHPVARILVDADGRNNFPQSKSQSETDLFDLGIRRVVLSRGELFYNDRKSAIDGDLHDVEVQSRFDPSDRRYTGSIRYADGRLHIENMNPMPHGLSANFEATRAQFKIEQAMLTSGSSKVEFSATLEDYDQPRVVAHYQTQVDAADVRNVSKEATLPYGAVQLAGELRYASEPGKSLLETLTLDGNATSRTLQVRVEGKPPITVNDLSAQYHVEKGDLRLRNVKASLFGGRMTGELFMRDVTGAAETRAHAVLHDVGLTQLQALMNSPMPREVALLGTANANVDAFWRGPLNNLALSSDATVRGSLRQVRGTAPPIPFNADLHARYDASTDQASFSQSSVRMPQTSLTLNGTVSSQTALNVQLQSNDLREIETLVHTFHPVEPLGLAGAGTFAGTVRGSANAPQIAGQLRATSLHVRGTEWRAIETGLEATPSHITLKNGRATPAMRGQLAFNIDVGLQNWEFTETSPIDVKLSASQLNAQDLMNLSGQQFPVTGTLAANVSVQGSQSNLLGEGVVTLTGGAIYDEPVNSANLNFQGSGEQLRGKLDVRMPAGAARGNFVVSPKQRSYEATIDAAGLRLEQLHAIKARNVHLAGAIDLKASGRGTLDNPGLQLAVHAPQLQLENQTLSGFTLQANVQDHAANVTLDSQSHDVFVRGRGTVELQGDYNVDAVFDTSAISLQPLVAAYLPAQANNVNGQTEIHARVRGPLRDSSSLEGRLTIPVLAMNYRNTVNLAAANIQIDYAKGLLTIQPAAIRGTGTDIQFQGTIPVNGSAPAAVRAVGTVDLRVVELFAPDVTSSGQLRLNIDGTGGRSNANVQGRIEVVNASFAAGGAPLGLQNGNGVLLLTNDGLEIERFQGKAGSGTLTLRGGLKYRPSVQFNVIMASNGVRMSFPRGVRETMDANLTLTGSPEAGVIRGQVRLQEISFARDFDFAELLGELSAETAVPADGFAKNLDLDVSVRSSNDVNLVSSKLSLQGAANLQLRGTAAKPVLTGRVNVHSGDLVFRGNRYVLQPSTVEFINPYETEPVVNLEVDTKVQAYNVHMRMRGPLDRLQTTYTSDPSLPPADVINLLVFGKTTEATDANPVQGNLGAQSLIASTVSSQITNRVEKVAGISQLSVDPVLGGNQKNTGARVTIQQRVTGNLFVAFSTDATSTEREVIKLEYQMSPKMSVSGVRDQNGGFAFDVRIRKTW